MARNLSRKLFMSKSFMTWAGGVIVNGEKLFSDKDLMAAIFKVAEPIEAEELDAIFSHALSNGFDLVALVAYLKNEKKLDVAPIEGQLAIVPESNPSSGADDGTDEAPLTTDPPAMLPPPLPNHVPASETQSLDGGNADPAETPAAVPSDAGSSEPVAKSKVAKKPKIGLGAWFSGARAKIAGMFPEKKAASTETSQTKEPSKVGAKLSETSAEFGKFVLSRWQTFAIVTIALLFIVGIAYLGPVNAESGQPSFQTTGAPINSLPVVVFFVFVIAFPLVFEASQRGDLSDAFVVLLCLVMSSLAAAYEMEWSTITFSSGRPLGAYLVGALYLTPYPLLWQAASTNKTKNVFGLKALSKYDFSPVFNTLLLFWAAAKTHVYWPWLPNPCFFPENFYLIAGVAFMFLELAGNIYNLLFSVVVGVSAGYLIFDDERFWWIFVVYLALVLYASTDKATKEITMNVDNKPTGSGEGGTSFGSGVRTKRFVPYDLLTGALWITAITAVVWYGNPSFPIVLPF